jgi:hypothetical protein
MTLHESMLRPFSRWLQPFPDESALGYFRRLVANEEHNSAAVYAREIGLDGVHPDPEKILQAVLTLPMDEMWKDRLRNATPMSRGNRIALAGQELRPRQFSITARRFCPGCLYEAAYDRTWWDVVAVQRCPVHDEPIVNRDEEGRIQRWWWPYPGESRWGGALARRCHRADGVISIEKYIVGRLGFGPKLVAPILDSFSLADAIDGCRFAGRMVSGKWSEAAGLIPAEAPDDFYELGFSVLCGNRADCVESVKAWIRAEFPAHVRERGHYIVFGALNKKRDNVLSPTLAEFFQRVMRKAQSAANRPVQRVFTEEEFYADDVGMIALAKRLGIRCRAASNIAKRIGVLPNRPSSRTRIRFAPDEVEQIDEFINGLVTYADAAKILGLPLYQVKPLVDSGHLQRLPRICCRGSREAALIRSEVHELLRRTTENVPVVSSSGTTGLVSAAARLGMEAGLLASLVVSGRIKAVGRAEGPLAFRNLRFARSMNAPAGVKTRRRKPRDRTKEKNSKRISAVELARRVGMDEACSRLHVRRETLELWERAYAERGRQGLIELKYEARHPQTTPMVVADRVKKLGLLDERNGCDRISAILTAEGTPISSATAWKILKKAGLATVRDRRRATNARLRQALPFPNPI